MTIKGWAKGPIELLQHGLEHLEKGTDFDRRMAMIVIDNAVEVAIKTYLGLPKRATGLHVPKNEYDGACQTFPALLDCLEKYASGKLSEIDLADIEWNHRIRNQLYHQGNGITVESERAEVFAKIATQLLCNLFEVDSMVFESRSTSVGEFLEDWADLERELRRHGSRYVKTTTGRPHAARELARYMVDAGILSMSYLQELEALSRIRNEMAHGGDIPEHRELRSAVSRVKALSKTLGKLEGK